MKKKLLGLVLFTVLVLAIGAGAYAATNFTMSYLPGTTDTVTNMPADDSGTGGTPYTVSGTVPQRAGYEFISWTLDYGVANTYTLNYVVSGDPNHGNAKPGDAVEPSSVTDIPAGGSVTLAAPLSSAWQTLDGSPLPEKESYKVNYLEEGTDKVLAPPKVVPDQTIGDTVTEVAIDIDGYILVDDVSKSLTIRHSHVGKWTFTGWCSDEACTQPVTEVTNINADVTVYGKWVYSETENNNEITFYYKNMPAVKYTDYTVTYIDLETGEQIIPDTIREHVEIGSVQREVAPEVYGYTIFDPPEGYIDYTVVENGLVVFLYYWDPV